MGTPSNFLGLLHRAAPRLAKDFFVCRRCIHQQAVYRPHHKSTRQTPFLIAFRSQAFRTSRSQSTAASTQHVQSPLGILSRSITKSKGTSQGSVAARSSFPETSRNSVAYWLLGSAASVFGLVIFGGLTRLTESGLSITEWRPVTGSMPPTTPEKWDSEFALYRSSPEFKLLNPRMTLDEFKQIYFMEWTHRLWGRIVGITFLLPTAYFIIRKRVTARMAIKLLGICGLIGFQGVLGWWMVKSGLKDDLFAAGSHPRVSQYRLTAHLGTAFICYLAMVWNGMTILQENRMLSHPLESQKALEKLAAPGLRTFRRSVAALAILVFVTAMSGGLVAGLDAGLIYNEFPYMGLGLTPPRKELWDTFYSHVPDHSDLWWRNMLENPSLVQLDHRIMATTTFTAVMSLWAYTRFNPRVRSLMTISARNGVTGIVSLVWLQVILGISTLLYLVPVPVASAHQAGALALLTGTAVLARRIWIPQRTARLIGQRTAQMRTGAEHIGRRSPDSLLAAKLGRDVVQRPR